MRPSANDTGGLTLRCVGCGGGHATVSPPLPQPDPNVYWRTPEQEEPPLGKRILLLTWEGCCSDGLWDGSCHAWSYMPSVPDALKRQREAHWAKLLHPVPTHPEAPDGP
jgi:hypothetical protein